MALDFCGNTQCQTLLEDLEDLDSQRRVEHKFHWQTGNREFHTKLKPKTNNSLFVRKVITLLLFTKTVFIT